MFKALFTVASLVTLSGCASTLGTFLNRPVVEDNVHDTLSTMSLSADRRTVIIKTIGEDKGKFCAEPPPDTANNLKTEVEASLEAKKAKADIQAALSLKDKLDINVVVIAERTAALDAFRTGVYALCQFHLNGAVKAEQIQAMFTRLIDSYEKNHAVARPVAAAPTLPVVPVATAPTAGPATAAATGDAPKTATARASLR